MRLFSPHKHKWKVVELRYPVVVQRDAVLSNGFDRYEQDYLYKGTAVYESCDCGATRVRDIAGKIEIWHDNLIEVPVTTSPKHGSRKRS
jgi:hypothetical protein